MTGRINKNWDQSEKRLQEREEGTIPGKGWGIVDQTFQETEEGFRSKSIKLGQIRWYQEVIIIYSYMVCHKKNVTRVWEAWAPAVLQVKLARAT